MTISPAAVIALRALRSIVNEDPADRQLADWQVEANEYLDRLDVLLARAEPQKEQFDDQYSQSRLDRSNRATDSTSAVFASDRDEAERNESGQDLRVSRVSSPNHRATRQYGEVAPDDIQPQEGTLNEFGLPEQRYPNTLQSYRTPARVEPPPPEQEMLKRLVMAWDLDDDMEFLAAIVAARKALGVRLADRDDEDADAELLEANGYTRDGMPLVAHRAPPTQEPTHRLLSREDLEAIAPLVRVED